MYAINEAINPLSHPPILVPPKAEIAREGSELSKVNPSKPHSCSRCSKTFSSVHQLAQHTRVHTGEKPYKCSFCEKRFKQQSHVKAHARLHTGERPYKCSEPACGRTFIQLSNLQQHMSQHSGKPEKARGTNFHCQICGKGFATDSSLALHCEKKHKELVGEFLRRPPKMKPFLCTICNKGYTTESALSIHAAKHKSPDSEGSSTSTDQTGESSSQQQSGYGCNVCPETFISSEGLVEHMKVAHDLLRNPLPYATLPFGPQGLHPWYDHPHNIPFTSHQGPISPPSFPPKTHHHHKVITPK